MQNIFKDKDGKVVIGQKPNWQILVAFAALLLSTADIAGSGGFFYFIAQVALVYWALEEVFFGVNIFRRVLGLFVFTLVLLNNL